MTKDKRRDRKRGIKMTHKENIRAILECNFAGFKDEIIDNACNRILEQEPKTGRWVKKENDICWWYVCSECGQEPLKNKWNYDELSRYCPNCGAKMESEETETWNSMHGQITAPKGTFERIFNDADDNDI